MISLEGLDYVDFGCTTANAGTLMTKRFAAEKGIHVSDDPKQIALAQAAGGTAMQTALDSRDQFEGKVRFSYIGGCLERQPDMASVAKIIDIAIHISRSFIIIRLPWFDSDGALLSQGMKFNWSDTSRHTMPLTTLQMHRLLAPRLEKGGAERFAIYGSKPITKSSDERIVPLSAPRNCGKYVAREHGPKKVIALPEPCYAEQIVVVARKTAAHLDWVQSRLRDVTLIFDSGSKPAIKSIPSPDKLRRARPIVAPARKRIPAR